MLIFGFEMFDEFLILERTVIAHQRYCNRFYHSKNSFCNASIFAKKKKDNQIIM